MRYYFKLVGLLISIQFATGCAFYSGISGKVIAHPNHDGLYLFLFRYSPFIGKYTLGWDALLQEEKNANTFDEKSAVWQNAINKSVPIYLSENKIIPKECIYGITVIGSNRDEGGGGTTSFKCKEK